MNHLCQCFATSSNASNFIIHSIMTETQPLLPNHHTVPHLGTWAVMSLIINKMIGTGIFSTPSLIFSLSGSIGTSLILWALGGVVTFCGLSIYLEFGLELPFSGGEKNYLQRVWTRPSGLVECVYALQIVLLGFSSGNSYAFGKYVLFALGFDGDLDTQSRWIGVGVITFVVYLHIIHPQQGTRFFSVIGGVKMLILLLIIVLGVLSWLGVIKVDGDSKNFEDIWRPYEGYRGNGYNISVALLQVIYSFKGWENANYVLSEVKNPHHALKIAAPLSVAITTVFYFLVILSYYVVVPQEQLKDSGVLIAGIFFRKIFGNTFSSRVLPLLISISNFGNVLAVAFSHSRINQELAREGLIPWSSYFSKLKNSLVLHWFVTVFVLLAPPNGDIYQLVVNLYSYPGTWVNIFVTLGLLYLHTHSTQEKWGVKPREQSWHAHWTACLVFLVSNVFLALFPFIPPPESVDTGNYPYYVFPVTGCSVLALGVIYWFVRSRQ